MRITNNDNKTQPAPATRPPKADAAAQELIQNARNGDAAAFEQLYSAHSRHVYSVCLRILKNAADAEDATQQVFLSLFRKIGSFRGESSLSTWLHRVAVNAALMHLRRTRLAEARTESLEADELPPATISDHSMRGATDRINLRRALQKLPAGCKRMFMLHTVLGYEHQEIAKLEGVSVGCSKSQVHKARKRLQGLLAPFRQMAPSHQAAE